MDDVRARVGDGQITNPVSLDSPPYPDARFALVGPNAYQVNTQYIMGATDQGATLPFVSYSVLKNARMGCRCDIFASHAWGEGIYEFANYLLASWTEGSIGAYVCFLSNPQNLDMASLISTPNTSPFFRVLAARPRSVVMVSNSNAVIHSRLWCCYEAHAAMRFELNVTVAGEPLWLIAAEGREAARKLFDEAASVQGAAEHLRDTLQELIQSASDPFILRRRSMLSRTCSKA